MRRFRHIFLTIAICVSPAFAQSDAASVCPSIAVRGPAGFVEPGDFAEYTVGIDVGDESYPIEILWSVSKGEIKEGQGTRSIKVIQPDASIVATVDLKGIPAGCPSTASEWSSRHLPPTAKKIYELQPDQPISENNIRPIARAALDRPTNQLYILAGDVGGKNSISFQRKSWSILKLLSENGIARDRVMMTTVYSNVEKFQFWLVPPGANNPTCTECGELKKITTTCPTIVVTGPAGVTEPGGLMTFIARLEGRFPPNIEYNWTVTDATILDGQGTLQITVKKGGTKWRFVKPVATFEVKGLPETCPNSASETETTTAHWETTLQREYRATSLSNELKHVDGLNLEAVTDGPFRLYFVIGVPGRYQVGELRTRAAALKSHLLKKSVPDDRIVFRFHEDPTSTSRVYFVYLDSEPARPNGRLLLQIPSSGR